MQRFDKIIIGAGLYGLYSALFCAKRGQRVIVLELIEHCFANDSTLQDRYFTAHTCIE